ncbi:MAG: hypothetical protein IPH00_16920 [Flavobacteriales bacterium]|nr:hypothetical protein [Flavobacteriales bacterium]
MADMAAALAANGKLLLERLCAGGRRGDGQVRHGRGFEHVLTLEEGDGRL